MRSRRAIPRLKRRAEKVVNISNISGARLAITCSQPAPIIAWRIERWSEGAPVAHTFGRGIVFYLIHGRLAVRNLDSELMVLDEATGSELRRLQFPDIG
jgi:hypothetical protein